jgi:hypothetical protein
LREGAFCKLTRNGAVENKYFITCMAPRGGGDKIVICIFFVSDDEFLHAVMCETYHQQQNSGSILGLKKKV